MSNPQPQNLSGERRASERRPVGAATTMRGANASPSLVTVQDLSSHGFRISGAGMLSVGDPVRLGLHGAGRADAMVVWTDGKACGCAFDTPLDPSTMAAAFSGDNVETIHFAVEQTSSEGGFTLQPARRYPKTGLVIIVGACALFWGLVLVARQLF